MIVMSGLFLIYREHVRHRELTAGITARRIWAKLVSTPLLVGSCCAAGSAGPVARDRSTAATCVGLGPGFAGRTAWFVMGLPALAALPLLVLASSARGPAAWLPLLLWLVHYAYRTVLFPALMRPGQRLSPVAGRVRDRLQPAQWLQQRQRAGHNAYAGAACRASHRDRRVRLLAGFLVHCHADHVIRALRGPGEQGYRVPQEGCSAGSAPPTISAKSSSGAAGRS
jgi:hypothetical protein